MKWLMRRYPVQTVRTIMWVRRVSAGLRVGSEITEGVGRAVERRSRKEIL